MTLDQAKFSLSNKISDLKRALRNRKIELSIKDSREAKVFFNGFEHVKSFETYVISDLYREVKSLIDYTYMHELDDAKRKKLSMYFVMLLSFKEFKNDINFQDNFQQLNPKQMAVIEDFQNIQEKLRHDVIRDLKSEYFDANDSSTTDFTRIQWNGNRKQLAELFIELENKKWVSYKEGELKPISKTITELFFINESGKNQSPNAESFYTIFRPDPKFALPKYPYTAKYQKVFTATYQQMFNEIIPNKNH